jgi:ribosomal protein S18 acetylase RimI-like enzyme
MTTNPTPATEVRISILSDATPDIVAALNRLLPQLSSSPTLLGEDDLRALVDFPTVRILLASVEGEPAGMLSLGWISTPTGKKAFIDDVVVDERHRGRGIGEALTQEALNQARALGAKSVDLTSRPSREAANRLYQRIGFQKRETNSYRYTL